jgi:DNA helicase-2/ATP-dependent DNA helicase PcrA
MSVVSSGSPFSTDFTLRENAYHQLREKLGAVLPDTSSALAAYQPHGDEFQLKVIHAAERTIRLVAPAGSGKTQTVVHRLLARAKAGVKPRRLLALTFDTAAASSLRAKYGDELARLGLAAGGESAAVETLNAFGYSTILKNFFPAEHKPVLEPKRRSWLFREMRNELQELSAEHVALLPGGLRDSFYPELFSKLKNQLFDPRAFASQSLADYLLDDGDLALALFEEAGDDASMFKIIQAIDWFYRRYEERLAQDQVIDFDDQKLRAFVCLTHTPGVQKAVQNRYDEVIVDEFQDINLLDFEFIRMIAGSAVLVVTGDDDQAIYGFRGCSPEYIINLEDHVQRGGHGSYELARNYRCPPNLVAHATRLIRHNTWRIPKNTTAHLETPADIVVVDSLSTGLEARLVVDRMQQIRAANPLLTYRDFAVLYRTHAQCAAPQVEFILRGVPYNVKEEHNILNNEVLDRLLAVLRLKLATLRGDLPASHDCAIAVRSYYRTMRPAVQKTVESFFGTHDRRRWLDQIQTPEFQTIMPSRPVATLAAALGGAMKGTSLLATLEVLAKFKGLQAMVGSLEDVADDKAPLSEIYEIAMNLGDNIGGFVATVQDAMNLARKDRAGHDEGGVALRTYFGAKGLQWHTVFLIGCNEGLIPHRRASGHPLKLEEERRLFYVGMTRATANLIVSYLQNVAKASVQRSRFIAEAGLAV